MKMRGVASGVPRTAAIIPAAGSGIRMGRGRAKQFLDLGGRPLLAVTLQPFQDCKEVEAIILVVPSADVDYCRKEIVDRFNLKKVRKIIPGGKTRQDSVRMGIEATEGEYGQVVIHDGARPLISVSFIHRVIDEARMHRAVITGLPVKETVKEISDNLEVIGTYNRQRLWLIQTPQAFRYEDLLAAHHAALKTGWDTATDDAALVEKLGLPVKVIEGSEKNIKITTPNDMALADFLLSRKSKELRK